MSSVETLCTSCVAAATTSRHSNADYNSGTAKTMVIVNAMMTVMVTDRATARHPPLLLRRLPTPAMSRIRMASLVAVAHHGNAKYNGSAATIMVTVHVLGSAIFVTH